MVLIVKQGHQENLGTWRAAQMKQAENQFPHLSGETAAWSRAVLSCNVSTFADGKPTKIFCL